MAQSGVPIMRVVVVTPDRFLGDIVGDLNVRGAAIHKIAPVGELQGILAFVPMTELHGYPDDLDRLTRRQARYEIKFSHFREDGGPDDRAGVPSPLKPTPPSLSARAAATPPHDTSENEPHL
jgi:translation elongation factor EF-G